MANNAVVGILRALLTLDSAQFESGMRKAQDSAKSFSRSTKQIGAQATQIGSALTRTLTLPILGFGVAVSKAAIDFESSFAGVRKTVEATEAEFAQMAKAFRGLSKEIPVNVNELNRLGEAAGALGIAKGDIVEFAKVMALLGVTTNVTSDQAAESIAQIQNVFQSAGKDTDRFASALVHLGNNGASTEKQILELTQRLASAGRAVGMSQADVMGFAAAMADVGIEAEAGGTALSRVFADISIAASNGGEDIAAFAQIAGKSSEDFAKLFKDDARTAVLTFIEGLGRAKDAGGDLNLILQDLGFTEARQARALRDLALSSANLRRQLDNAKQGWQENSALSEEAAKRFETTASQLTLLWNRIKDVGITIGNALLPMIKATVKAFDAVMPLIERASKAFALMPMPIQALAVALGLVAAAAGPLIFAFGQLALAASALAGAFTKNGIATKVLAGNFGLLTAAQRVAAVDAAITARAYTALAAAQVTAGTSATVMGAKMTLATAQTMAANVAARVTAAAQAALAIAMNVTGGSALVMGARMAIATAATRASAAAAGLASMATGALSLAYLGLTRVLWPLTVAFGLFQFGKWIEGATGLGTQIGKLTLRLGELLRIVPRGTAEWYEHARAQKRSADASRDQAEAQRELREQMAQATKDRISGDDLQREVLAIHSSVLKLNAEGRMTPDIWRRVAGELKALQEQGAKLPAHLQFTVDSWGKYAPAVKTAAGATQNMTAELKAAEAQLGASGKAAFDFFGEELKQRALGAVASIGNVANVSRMTADAQRELADILMEAVGAWEANGQAIPKTVAQLLDAVRAAKAVTSQLEIINDLQPNLAPPEPTVDDAIAELQRLEKAASDWREYQNFINLRIMEDEAEILRRRLEPWQQFFGAITNELRGMAFETTGKLFSTLFGGSIGDDTARREARALRQEFERLRDSGIASAEDITEARLAMLQAEARAGSAFADRFKAIWDGIKRHLFNVFDMILERFVNNLLKGMLDSLLKTGIGQKLGDWIGKAVGLPSLAGSAASTVLGVGATAAGVGAATVGGAAAAGTSSLALAPGLVAGLNAQAGVGAAAAGTAAGGGGMAGMAALMTNPLTIGIAAAAIATPFIVKGLKALFGGPSDLDRIKEARTLTQQGVTVDQLPDWIRNDSSTMRRIREGRLFDPVQFSVFGRRMGEGLIDALQPRVSMPSFASSAREAITPSERASSSMMSQQQVPSVVHNHNWNVSTWDTADWRRNFTNKILPEFRFSVMNDPATRVSVREAALT